MRKIAVIDAETDPFKYKRVPKPFLWGYFDGEVYRTFERTEDVVEFLFHKEIIIFAHNGGRFDYFFLYDYINLYEEITVINGRLSKFKIGLCEFRDSINILPVPLSAYKKEKINYNIFEEGERNKPENRKKIRAYLRSDCIYQYEMVVGFIKEAGNHLTLASSSMAAWLKLSKKRAPKTNWIYYDTIKPFYYGGRVECFQKGWFEKDFIMGDINSAYPKAMKEKHPIGKCKTLFRMPHDKNVYKTFFHINAISHGAFPYKEKYSGTYFPNDDVKREYFITGYELISALNNNAIKDMKLIKCFFWENVIDFEEYVNYYYNMRLKAQKESNKILDLVCKLRLNSLYGKFGANPDNYSINMIFDKDEMDIMYKEGYDLFGFLGNKLVGGKDLTEKQTRFYNIATAASITGYVRAFLFDSLLKVDTPYYCDTDCIVCKDIRDLDIGDKLGQWKIEGEFDKGGIAGKKLYAFHKKGNLKKDEKRWKIASKGVKLNHRQIKEICDGKTILYRFKEPSFSIKKKEPVFIERKISLT